MQLQKLVILIEQKEYEKEVQKLELCLKQEGLSTEICSACGLTERKCMTLVSETKGVLVLTDSERIWKQILSIGGAVVVFLHEGNKEADFSGIKYAMESLEGLDALYFERIYQRLTGQPWTILQTKRCILRETLEEDVDAFYEIYSDSVMTKYTEALYEDKEKERQYVRDYRKYVYSFYEFGIWTVIDKDTGEVIGRAGINMREDCEIPEIGFAIGVPWQRKGIAFEICLGIMEYARKQLQMDVIQALVQPENKASVRLCEKLGFESKGSVEIKGITYTYFLRDLTG